jgi:hypothetical protein
MSTVHTAAELQRFADRRTTPAVERGVGVLLGAPPDVAAAAVDAVRSAGRLGEGLALHVLVHAARKGMDAANAVAALAAGAALPGGWSDFELRAAAEEAAEDVAAALRSPRGSAHVDATGDEAPAVVAGALRAGGAGTVLLRPPAAVHADGRPLLAALVDERWVRRLAMAAGWAVERSPATGAAAVLQEALDAGAALPAGVDPGDAAIPQRSVGYITLP